MSSSERKKVVLPKERKSVKVLRQERDAFVQGLPEFWDVPGRGEFYIYKSRLEHLDGQIKLAEEAELAGKPLPVCEPWSPTMVRVPLVITGDMRPMGPRIDEPPEPEIPHGPFSLRKTFDENGNELSLYDYAMRKLDGLPVFNEDGSVQR